MVENREKKDQLRIKRRSEKMSRIRQNFDSRLEAAINKQIHMELYSSYAYVAMVITN